VLCLSTFPHPAQAQQSCNILDVVMFISHIAFDSSFTTPLSSHATPDPTWAPSSASAAISLLGTSRQCFLVTSADLSPASQIQYPTRTCLAGHWKRHRKASRLQIPLPSSPHICDVEYRWSTLMAGLVYKHRRHNTVQPAVSHGTASNSSLCLSPLALGSWNATATFKSPIANTISRRYHGDPMVTLRKGKAAVKRL